MTTSVKRFLVLLTAAALLVAALGLASVGASAPPSAPAVRGLAAPQAAPPAAEFDPIDSWLVDLADPDDWNDPACAGWTLRYTLTFTNTSGETLIGVVLSDTLPTNTEYKESDGGVFDGVDSVQWDIGLVVADEVVTRDLVIRPYTSIPAGTVITDVVAVLIGDLVIENAQEGTTIQKCAEPTATPSPTRPSPTPEPTNTATPEPPTPTATPELNDGKTIWLPIVVNQFER